MTVENSSLEEKSLYGAGRPPKADGNKRQQLQFSLYAEDVGRLEQLTDNRSEFIRHCIAEAWTKQNGQEKMITVQIPQSLLQDVLTLFKPRLPPNRAALLQALLEDLFVE